MRIRPETPEQAVHTQEAVFGGSNGRRHLPCWGSKLQVECDSNPGNVSDDVKRREAGERVRVVRVRGFRIPVFFVFCLGDGRS